jgi:hypothetical protein
LGELLWRKSHRGNHFGYGKRQRGDQGPSVANVMRVSLAGWYG